MTIPPRPGRPWPLLPAPEKFACFFCDGGTYDPDGICGQCRSEGKSYDEPTERPVLTEAEYAAWVEHRGHELAGQFTALLPQEIRDAGIRFEWGTDGP